jgi:hypothetical protein
MVLLNNQSVAFASSTLPPALPSEALDAVLTYTAWGLLPFYEKLFGTVPAITVLSHCVV